MSVSVSMPQLGESVTEGTVTRWLKKEGERVEVDEPLLEVSTDKVDTEIPSPASGILRGIAVDEDETVAVGAHSSGRHSSGRHSSGGLGSGGLGSGGLGSARGRAGPGQLGRLELAGIAAQLRAARAALPRGLAGLSGFVRALDARLCATACVRSAPVVPPLRPGSGRWRGPGG